MAVLQPKHAIPGFGLGIGWSSTSLTTNQHFNSQYDGNHAAATNASSPYYEHVLPGNPSDMNYYSSGPSSPWNGCLEPFSSSPYQATSDLHYGHHHHHHSADEKQQQTVNGHHHLGHLPLKSSVVTSEVDAGGVEALLGAGIRRQQKVMTSDGKGMVVEMLLTDDQLLRLYVDLNNDDGGATRTGMIEKLRRELAFFRSAAASRSHIGTSLLPLLPCLVASGILYLHDGGDESSSENNDKDSDGTNRHNKNHQDGSAGDDVYHHDCIALPWDGTNEPPLPPSLTPLVPAGMTDDDSIKGSAMMSMRELRRRSGEKGKLGSTSPQGRRRRGVVLLSSNRGGVKLKKRTAAGGGGGGNHHRSTAANSGTVATRNDKRSMKLTKEGHEVSPNMHARCHHSGTTGGHAGAAADADVSVGIPYIVTCRRHADAWTLEEIIDLMTPSDYEEVAAFLGSALHALHTLPVPVSHPLYKPPHATAATAAATATAGETAATEDATPQRSSSSNSSSPAREGRSSSSSRSLQRARSAEPFSWRCIEDQPEETVHRSEDKTDDVSKVGMDWSSFLSILREGQRRVFEESLFAPSEAIPFHLASEICSYLPQDPITLLPKQPLFVRPSWLHTNLTSGSILLTGSSDFAKSRMESCLLSTHKGYPGPFASFSNESNHAPMLSPVSVLNETDDLFAIALRHGLAKQQPKLRPAQRLFCPVAIDDFGGVGTGDPIYDIVIMHICIFHCDENLLRVFLHNYVIDFGPRSSSKVSYRAMCYTILHERSLMLTLFQKRPDLMRCPTLSAVEEALWGVLNDFAQ